MNYTEMRSIQINQNELVTFMFNEFPGMVGETVRTVTAYVTNFELITTAPVSYQDLRQIYKTLGGKNTRLEFWFAMKAMSPKAMADRVEESRLDAISRIK